MAAVAVIGALVILGFTMAVTGLKLDFTERLLIFSIAVGVAWFFLASH